MHPCAEDELPTAAASRSMRGMLRQPARAWSTCGVSAVRAAGRRHYTGLSRSPFLAHSFTAMRHAPPLTWNQAAAPLVTSAASVCRRGAPGCPSSHLQGKTTASLGNSWHASAGSATRLAVRFRCLLSSSVGRPSRLITFLPAVWVSTTSCQALLVAPAPTLHVSTADQLPILSVILSRLRSVQVPR